MKNLYIKKLFFFLLLLPVSGCYDLLPPPVIPENIGNPPQKPVLVYPENNSFVVGNIIDLEWSCEDPDQEILKFDLYLGTSENPPLYAEDLGYYDYKITDLLSDKTYYWKIVAHDKYNEIEGPVWSFKTSIIGEEMYGGIVFYLDNTGKHGLVCTSGEIESDGSIFFDWGDNEIYNATGDDIGAGLENTATIVNTYSGSEMIAAEACYYLIYNGYSDWYLPSKTELLYMYENLQKNDIGNFRYSQYWSSTEYDIDEAYSINFVNGSIRTDYKYYGNYIRAVRQF